MPAPAQSGKFAAHALRGPLPAQLPGTSRGGAGRLWCAMCVIALLVYTLTANRGVQWQDSGWQQYRILTGSLVHPGGLALTHPLHYWLGRGSVAIVGFARGAIEPAFAITLVSCLAGAIAVANLAATVRTLSNRDDAASIAALALLFSHALWQHATQTESYAITAALLTTEWLFLARFARGGSGVSLIGMAAANGLGLANHMLASLSTPIVLAVVLWAVHTRRSSILHAVAAAFAWIVATLPFTGLIASVAFSTGDLGHALYSAAFGIYAPDVLNVRPRLQLLTIAGAFVAYALPGMSIPFALHAIVGKTAAPRVFFWPALAYLLNHGVFVARYSIPDQYTFVFAFCACLSLFAGLGLADILSSWTGVWRRLLLASGVLTALWTPAVYYAAYRVVSQRGWIERRMTAKPFRDSTASVLLPWGVTHAEAAQANAALRDAVGTGSGLILIGDNMMEHAVRLAQSDGGLSRSCGIVVLMDSFIGGPKPDPAQLASRIREAAARGAPVVLLPRVRNSPEIGIDGFAWRARGDLFELERSATP